jgi:hypothetical protein
MISTGIPSNSGTRMKMGFNAYNLGAPMMKNILELRDVTTETSLSLDIWSLTKAKNIE